jgi:hypothetical protein
LTLFQDAKRLILELPKRAIRELIPLSEVPVFQVPLWQKMADRNEPAREGATGRFVAGCPS